METHRHRLILLLASLKVNALLPTDTFIKVTKGLMGNELASARRKAMELLNNKLQHRTPWDERQVRQPPDRTPPENIYDYYSEHLSDFLSVRRRSASCCS